MSLDNFRAIFDLLASDGFQVIRHIELFARLYLQNTTALLIRIFLILIEIGRHYPHKLLFIF